MFNTRKVLGLLLWVWALVGRPAAAQPAPLTLTSSYELAEQNAPLRRRLALNNAQTANIQSRLSTQRRLPQLSVNGQASYQSEVTQVPIEAPGITAVAKDQYRLTLDAVQTLYEGGTTRRQLELEAASNQVNNQQVAVGLYQLREQVNGLFFGVLLTDENLRLRQALRTDLRTRHQALTARRANGTATGQDLARLDAEVVNLDQQLRELAVSRAGLLSQLAQLLGQPLTADTRLEAPTALPPATPRPEYQLYDFQRAQLASQRQLNDARLAPRLSLYGQAGYGRPGLNLLRNDFHGYSQGGVRLTWALNNYYTRRQDREAIHLGSEAVAVQQAQFEQQQRVALAGQQAEMARYETLLETDRQLIPLREKIQATAAVQLDHGIIGFSDYFTEANLLTQARLREQLHRLQLLQAQVAAQTTAGAPVPQPTPVPNPLPCQP